MPEALPAMREHLQHWEKELAFALAAEDEQRIKQAQRFVVQCEQVIRALEAAATVARA